MLSRAHCIVQVIRRLGPTKPYIPISKILLTNTRIKKSSELKAFNAIGIIQCCIDTINTTFGGIQFHHSDKLRF